MLDTLRRRGNTGDEGVALVVAMALTGLASALMVTMVTVTIGEGRSTGRDRARAAAVTTAEGAVDLALATIQNSAVAVLPCEPQSVTSTQNRPDVMTITTAVTYYAANGAEVPCAQVKSGAVVATRAAVFGTSESQPAGGGREVQRKVESLVELKPTYANDLNKAIFGDKGVVVSNNFDLYGNVGPDADVYTNGDFQCENNQHYRGSIYAQGTIRMNNTCTIDVNAHAGAGFLGSKGSVLGDVIVGISGSAAMTGTAVSGKVRASSVTPASYCTSNPGKCVLQPQAAPPAQDFPQIGSSTTPWTEQGYTVVPRNGCGTGSPASDPAAWITSTADDVTSKTLLSTSCRLEFPTNVKTIRLNQDLAIFAAGGVDLSQSLEFVSTQPSAAPRNLYLIQPYGSACPTGLAGISLTQQVTMAPSVHELIYSPCNVVKANNSTLYGQVYAGGTATIDNKTDAYYKPLPVFGITNSTTVKSYAADILYKREDVA